MHSPILYEPPAHRAEGAAIVAVAGAALLVAAGAIAFVAMAGVPAPHVELPSSDKVAIAIALPAAVASVMARLLGRPRAIHETPLGERRLQLPDADLDALLAPIREGRPAEGHEHGQVARSGTARPRWVRRLDEWSSATAAGSPDDRSVVPVGAWADGWEADAGPAPGTTAGGEVATRA